MKKNINEDFSQKSFDNDLKELFSVVPKQIHKSCREYAKLYFNVFDDMYIKSNAYYKQFIKTDLDYYYLKGLSLSELLEVFTKMAEAYLSQKIIYDIISVKTIKEMMEGSKQKTKKNLFYFSSDFTEFLLQRIFNPYISATINLIPRIKNFEQGGGSKKMLPLYYAIIDCAEGNGSTKNFRDTLRRVLKSSAKYVDIFGSDFDAAIKLQRDEFRKFANKNASKNYNLNSDEVFISFLCGSFRSDASYTGGTFRGAFKKYYDKKRKEQNKKQILNSILTTFHKPTSQN